MRPRTRTPLVDRRGTAATTDLLLPAGLPELIAMLLADCPPDRPVVVDG
ncbi:hypothetical protein [Streptomyces sp. NBC_00057]